VNIQNRTTTRPWGLVRGLVVLASIFACLPLAAQTYYKWVDDQGTVHYTADPPANRTYAEVDTQGQVIATREVAPPANSPDSTEPEQVQMPRQAPPDPELVAARCRQAQENLFWLQNKRRVILEKDDGSQQFLNEEEQQQMVEESRALMEQWCENVDLGNVPINGPPDGR